MSDVLGIFLLLLSFKFLFSRNSIIVNSIINAILPTMEGVLQTQGLQVQATSNALPTEGATP